MKAPWVIVHQGTLMNECTRCGDRMQLKLPVSASVYHAAAMAFIDLHAACPEPAPQEPTHAKPIEQT